MKKPEFTFVIPTFNEQDVIIKTLEDLRPIRIHINKARSEKIINKFYGKDPTKEFVWYP